MSEINNKIVRVGAPSSDDFVLDFNHILAYLPGSTTYGRVIVIGLGAKSQTRTLRIEVIGSFGVSQSCELDEKDAGYLLFKQQVRSKNPIVLTRAPNDPPILAYERSNPKNVLVFKQIKSSESARLNCWGDNYDFVRLEAVVEGIRRLFCIEYCPESKDVLEQIIEHERPLKQAFKYRRLSETISHARFFTSLDVQYRDRIPRAEGAHYK